MQLRRIQGVRVLHSFSPALLHADTREPSSAHLLADPAAFESALLDSSLILALSSPSSAGASADSAAQAKLVLLQQQGVCSTIARADAEAPATHPEGTRLDDEQTLELALGIARRRYEVLREALREASEAKETQ